MTIHISEAEYELLWETSNQSCDRPDLSADSDIIQICPQQLGRGYNKYIYLPGIEITIIKQEFFEDVRVEYPAKNCCRDYVEFGFNITGYNSRPSNISFLDWGVADEFDNGGVWEILAGQHILKVDIELESPERLLRFLPKNLQQLPLEMERLAQKENPQFYSHLGTITPAMRLALEQMLNCPFQGFTRNIYLESKCLELISLKLEQLNNDTEIIKLTVLKPDDLERIYWAKDILIRNLASPPSLLELARQVGINDRKLKEGFRQVFGNTVFGYLHDYRMLEAERLLQEQRMSINQVARALGYSSRSAFYTAFRKKFGISPSNY